MHLVKSSRFFGQCHIVKVLTHNTILATLQQTGARWLVVTATACVCYMYFKPIKFMIFLYGNVTIYESDTAHIYAMFTVVCHSRSQAKPATPNHQPLTL